MEKPFAALATHVVVDVHSRSAGGDGGRTLSATHVAPPLVDRTTVSAWPGAALSPNAMQVRARQNRLLSDVNDRPTARSDHVAPASSVTMTMAREPASPVK
jgi:hypothetical protein